MCLKVELVVHLVFERPFPALTLFGITIGVWHRRVCCRHVAEVNYF
jgi:hypothetical protein